MIAPEVARHREWAFAADYDQAIQSENAKILLQSSHQLWIFEWVEARGAQNRAAPRQNAKDWCSGKFEVIVLHQAAPAILDAQDVNVVRRSAPDDCPNDRIKSRTISTGSENSYSHILIPASGKLELVVFHDTKNSCDIWI